MENNEGVAEVPGRQWQDLLENVEWVLAAAAASLLENLRILKKAEVAPVSPECREAAREGIREDARILAEFYDAVRRRVAELPPPRSGPGSRGASIKPNDPDTVPP